MDKTNGYDRNKYGIIFNIQHYSVHDGPGIRTIVFLKGCPLRCKWCSNPESQQHYPELAYNINKCIGTGECGMCINKCESGAINEHNSKVQVNRDLCSNCLKCVDYCPSKALNPFGKLMTTEEVLSVVEKDSIFYSRSGGGLTVSGGEPLMQHEFTAGLLREAKRRRINTSIETCGLAQWDTAIKVFQQLDTIFYDIKCMDSEKHKEFTGVSNEQILDNFKKLCLSFPNIPKTVRTPVIPGFNSNEEDILAITDFLKDYPNLQYELLTYHPLGKSKYGFLGREYPLSRVERLNEEHISFLKKLAQSRLDFKVL